MRRTAGLLLLNWQWLSKYSARIGISDAELIPCLLPMLSFYFEIVSQLRLLGTLEFREMSLDVRLEIVLIIFKRVLYV